MGLTSRGDVNGFFDESIGARAEGLASLVLFGWWGMKTMKGEGMKEGLRLERGIG